MKYGMGGYPSLMGYGGPKKYKDGDVLDERTQALINSGAWKMGPDGVLVATSDEEKLASGMFVQDNNGQLRRSTPEEQNQFMYRQSLDQATWDMFNDNPLPTENDLARLDRAATARGGMTEAEARQYAARAFDPSAGPNMLFSAIAGAGGPGAVADVIGTSVTQGARAIGNSVLRRQFMRGVDDAVEYLDDVADVIPTPAPRPTPTPRPASQSTDLVPTGGSMVDDAGEAVIPKNRQLPAGQQSSGNTFYGENPYQYRHTRGSIDADGNPIGGRYGNSQPGGVYTSEPGLVVSRSGVPARVSNPPAVRGNNVPATIARNSPSPTPTPRPLPPGPDAPRTIPVSGRTVTAPTMPNFRVPGPPMGMFINNDDYRGPGGSTESVGGGYQGQMPAQGGSAGSGLEGGSGAAGSSGSGSGSGSGPGSSGNGSSEFNQAFREARHRGDMVFEWNGKSYGTRRKGETNDEHSMAMDQVRIKSRGAQMRNTPEQIGIQSVEEIKFDRPAAELQTRPAAGAPASKPAATGKDKITANRQENQTIRKGMRQERNADRKENRAGKLENRAAKLRGNSKPAPKPATTSNKATEDKAMERLNATVNRPMKDGGKKKMIKRADGSTSQRGLWDNIRANKGSGKKPTAEMLKQEKKIKAESKKDGGLKTPTNKGLKKLPKPVRNKMGFKKNGGYMKDRTK